MMHASTSPLYTIIASNDICAAMMDGPGGVALTTESIEEAVAFRQTMGRVNRQFAKDGEWFFNTWNADQVKDQKTGKKIPFHEAAPSQLATDPECWVLHPGDNWHGFEDLEDGYCMDHNEVAAPRLDNIPLEGTGNGFIPIPGTAPDSLKAGVCKPKRKTSQ